MLVKYFDVFNVIAQVLFTKNGTEPENYSREIHAYIYIYIYIYIYMYIYDSRITFISHHSCSYYLIIKGETNEKQNVLQRFGIRLLLIHSFSEILCLIIQLSNFAISLILYHLQYKRSEESHTLNFNFLNHILMKRSNALTNHYPVTKMTRTSSKVTN